MAFTLRMRRTASSLSHQPLLSGFKGAGVAKDRSLAANIDVDDVNGAVGQVFTAMRGIVKANLSVGRANEVFDEMRRVAD
jgi:hypothetical protein